MGKIKEWWQNHRPTTRRLAQLYAALLYNAHIKGFIDGEIYQGNAKVACVPGFNCYSCPGAIGACPLGSIQNALASSKNRAGYYVLGIIMLYGLILGRTICGWFCPLGLIQELLHKIPTPKIRKNRLTRVLSYLKYVIIGVFVVSIPLWYGLRYGIPVPGFCKYICPAGTFEGAMGLLSNPGNSNLFSMLGILFTRKFVIMLIIGLACIFCYRSFCRFLCPLGAIYGIFNKVALIGVKVDQSRCNHCGACVRSCQMDVRHVGDHECISCGKCMAACHQDAIAIKAGKITLKAPEAGCAGDPADAPAKRRRMSRIIWGVALAVLVFALVWFNFLDPAVKKAKAAPAASAAPAVAATTAPEPAATEVPVAEPVAVSYESTAPLGKEVGDQLPTFSTELVGGGTFDLADTRGKVVFINLWATYCTPCVQELPHFVELYHEHEGDIAMLAVHSSLVTDDVDAYLAERDWDIPFAIDSEDDTIYNIVGGSTLLPQTIVLNRKGEVIYNMTGSVTADVLASLYEQASGGETAAPSTVTQPSTAAAPVEQSSALPATVSYESTAPLGKEVGDQLPTFSTDLVGGGTFDLADTRGKVVFINLWATYCTPCVQELPHFVELYHEHESDVVMLAVHSSLVTDDVEAYLKERDWDIPFAIDSEDDTIYNIVGGSTLLPQTIVLNRKGEVIYNMTGSVTAEALASLYEQANGGETAAPTADAQPSTEVTVAAEKPAVQPATVSYESTAPLGKEVGDQLPTFSTELIGGGTFDLADTRGKVVFINLWATYCTPCVQELPHFVELYHEHEGDIAMLAVHSSLVTDDVDAYLKERDWDIPFAIDLDDDTIYNIVGGSTLLPQTIVLNRKGEVIYNMTGSVTTEALAALYEQAGGGEAAPAAGTQSSTAVTAAAVEPSVQPPAVSYESTAPLGKEIGDQLPTFSTELVGGGTFDLADTRGKVVFINLWATYCTPCVQELPHFVELYHEHEDDIAMVAVHASLVTDDVKDYLSQRDWDIPFAVDSEDDTIYNIVGGSSLLPQTIVLNRRGEVIYNMAGSVTADALASLYEQAAGE